MSWDVGAWVINTLKKLIETHGVQTFTSDGTFVVPPGVHKIFVTGCGGGQGGGTNSSSGNWEYKGAGGSGGECVIRETFSVIPGQQIQITIGKGGSAGNGNSHPIGGTTGATGGSTVVGSLITLRGGNSNNGTLIGSGYGGSGRSSYNGTERSKASDGFDGARGPGGKTDGSNKAGGGGSYGSGGCSKTGVAAGPGGGGSTGNKGGDGIVIIEW